MKKNAMVDHATHSFIIVAFINTLSRCFYYARDEIMAIWAEKQKEVCEQGISKWKIYTLETVISLINIFEELAIY